MTPKLIVVIIAGLVIIVAAAAVINVIAKVRNAIAPIAKLAELAGGLDREQLEYEIDTTPKSVNGMTSIYLPKIQNDFPEFNYYEFRTRVENMMKSAFNAITTADVTRLLNASDDLTKQVNNIISTNRANNLSETYSDIEIHRTEIKNYRKTEGSCIITLQSSVGYIHFVTDKTGKVTKGDRDRTKQTRYDVDLVYIQDPDKLSEGGTLLSNNCPNCGAPVKTVGIKTCPYCGSHVEGINVRSWAISSLKEC